MKMIESLIPKACLFNVTTYLTYFYIIYVNGTQSFIRPSTFKTIPEIKICLIRLISICRLFCNSKSHVLAEVYKTDFRCICGNIGKVNSRLITEKMLFFLMCTQQF